MISDYNYPKRQCVGGAVLLAAADDLVIQVGGKAFEVHIVVYKHKL